jgi:hypothetical protein
MEGEQEKDIVEEIRKEVSTMIQIREKQQSQILENLFRWFNNTKVIQEIKTKTMKS